MPVIYLVGLLKNHGDFWKKLAFVLRAESVHAKIMICPPQIRVFLERIVSLKHTWCAQKTMGFEILANPKTSFLKTKLYDAMNFATPSTIFDNISNVIL